MRKELAVPQSPSGRSRSVPIGSRSIGVSLRPAIPRRVAPQQSPLPLHRPPTIVADSLLQRDNQMCRATSTPRMQPRPPSSMQANSSCRSAPPAFGRSRTPLPAGVPSLLCTPGDISILRRQYQSRPCSARRHWYPRKLRRLRRRPRRRRQNRRSEPTWCRRSSS